MSLPARFYAGFFVRIIYGTYTPQGRAMTVTTGEKLARFASNLNDDGDNVLQTVGTLAELPAAADNSGQRYYVDYIGVVKSNGTIWVPLEFRVTLEQFGGGAAKTGAENDAALSSAITHLKSLTTDSRLKGGFIDLWYGQYTFESQVIVPTKISLRGRGRGGTWIVADSGILPGVTGFVQLGESSSTVLTACALYDLTVDATAVSGLRGVYSNSINEHCGTFNCLVKTKTAAGIRVNLDDLGAGAGSPNNFSFEDTEVYVEDSNNTVNPMIIDVPGKAFRLIKAVTVIGDNFAAADPSERSNVGLLVTAGSGRIEGYHVEACVTGLQLGGASSAFGIEVDTVTDLGTAANPNRVCTDVVRTSVDSQNFVLHNIKNASSVNTINDVVNSIAITDSLCAFYTVSGGTVGQRVILCSSPNVEQQFNQVRLLAGLQHETTTKNANFTFSVSDAQVEYDGVGTITGTLPDALLNAGKEFYAINNATGTFNVAIDGGTSNVIYGLGGAAVSSVALAAQRLYKFKASRYGNGRWYMSYTEKNEVATTSELNDISDPINTQRKYVGKQVFNTTTSRPIYAAGGAAGDLWVYSDGTTAHTPV